MGGGIGAASWLFVAVWLGVCAGGSALYLLFLLLVSFSAPRRLAKISAAPAQSDLPPMRFAVVVPAHDEALVIDATLASLLAADYPPTAFEVVVIADNCSDETADIAQKRGVTVLQRTNLQERGKGYALQWAFENLLARTTPPDAFVVVDADTWVAPDFLSVMAYALRIRQNENGLAAVQGRYGVLNATENWRTALMAGAFDLFNHVKPLGRDALGLSVGLKGNGMAFTRAVMEAAPWQGTSITEDIDYGLDLLHIGVRVGYEPRALVRAQMPTTAKQAASQRERWEGGRTNLLKTRALPLLSEALRKRSLSLVDAATDLLVPPLAELAALLALWGIWIAIGTIFYLTAQPGVWSGLWIFAVLAFVVYIFGGFAVSGAPRQAYTALLFAPGYAVWKMALMAARPFRRKTAGGGTPSGEEWVRTERAPMPAAAPTGKDAAP